MGRLRTLAEAVLEVTAATPNVAKHPAYQRGLDFLQRGRMPDGQGYRDGPPRLLVQLGDVEGCELQRLAQEAQDDGTVRMAARFDIHPSRAGGAGVSMDGAIMEFWMSQSEGEPCDDSTKVQLAAALHTVCEERRDAIRAAFQGLLTADELVWRLVGWRQRGAWALERAAVEAVACRPAWVEETRGETWLAKHWEVWVPVTLDVVAYLRRQ